ncbi:molybdopterin-dependent oxidoreductase [Cognatishimia sp. MH4019]|uniref:molybdopterin-dependent oxidoreductase n=1 Tax=Cognatishimia sp. MH4019 TaxID=2854030 RepID=UPI001CD72FBE|nr:molybdopterin-dependent oxidoreductase [Cognatishimia sp. MH4019]
MARIHHSRAFAIVLALLFGWTSTALAQSVTDLQVTASSSKSDVISFSLADLDTMEQVVFSTTTIWTDGKVTFSGVPLKAVLDGVDASGTTVEMVALNDYKVAMPLSEVKDTAPIIATRMDGETMSVRDKGPYWIVFPYDQDTSYQTETIYAFSIWQLNRLKVVD